MTYIIEVTAEDIQKAEETRKALIVASGYKTTGVTHSDCPIAMALKRKFPLADFIHASHDHLRADNASTDTYWSVDSTATIRRFMRRWDRTWCAKPTRFRVITD